jgi:hypothetical protein
MRKWSVAIRHEIEKTPVPIVSDALVATRGLADGRLIPLLILDTSARPDVEDMIRAHKHLGPGDAESAWGAVSTLNRTKLRLLLSVIKPSRCLVVIEFDVLRHGGLIDRIVQSQGLYIQAGRPGDRLVKTPDHERILVGVPSREFRGDWERIFRKALFKDYRQRGLSRGDAKEAADSFLKEWRRVTSMRMQSDDDTDAEPSPA